MNLQKKADELFRRFDNDEIYTVRDLVLRSLEEGICIGLDNAVEIVKDINFPHGETNHLVVLRKVERALLAGKERDGSLIGAGKPDPCKPSTPVDKTLSPETRKDQPRNFMGGYHQPVSKDENPCKFHEHKTRCYKCNTFIAWEDLGHVDCIKKEVLRQVFADVEKILTKNRIVKQGTEAEMQGEVHLQRMKELESLKKERGL